MVVTAAISERALGVLLTVLRITTITRTLRDAYFAVMRAKPIRPTFIRCTTVFVVIGVALAVLGQFTLAEFLTPDGRISTMLVKGRLTGCSPELGGLMAPTIFCAGFRLPTAFVWVTSTPVGSNKGA